MSMMSNTRLLSHTWLRPSEGEEVLFVDLTDMTKARQKAGWKKLEFAMAQAAKEGLRYVWVDTCCINKESSAELAEAINSMYRWYQKSKACYVYLVARYRREYTSLLASLPDVFEDEVYSKLVVASDSNAQKQFEVLGRTVQFHLPVFDMPKREGIAMGSRGHAALLNCCLEDRPCKCVTMKLSSPGYGELLRESSGHCDILNASKRCTSWPLTVLRDSDNVGRNLDLQKQQRSGPVQCS